jgi:branched-chain amino acid transport system permease protein
MLGTGALGSAVEAIAYKPLRKKPRMMALITAVGVSMFLQNFPRALPFIGPAPRSFPALFPVTRYSVGGIQMTSTQIIMIVLSIVFMFALDRIVSKTRIGTQMRAVSMDKDAASLMGININQVISFTFFIGAALAAASGIFYASIYPQVDVYMGSWLGTNPLSPRCLAALAISAAQCWAVFIMASLKYSRHPSTPISDMPSALLF